MQIDWKKYKIPVAILVFAILIIVVIALNRGAKIISLPIPTSTVTPAPAGLGSELYEEAVNPVQNVPETNPFEAKTNPYKDVYKNPFD